MAIDIDENWLRPDVANGCDRRDPCHVGHDHFVAGADAEGKQGKVKGRCARRKRYGMPAAAMCGKGTLKPLMVLICAFVPGISHRIGDVVDLLLRDRWA